LGESVAAEVQLFIQQGKPLQYPQLTSDGFTVGKMSEPRQSQTQVGNRLYRVYVFFFALTPAKTGTLKLGPVDCNSEILVQPRGRRGGLGDPFGFFDNLMDRRQVTIKAEPITVKIDPLPTQNVPPGFGGAVGKFTMSLVVNPTNVSVGDPITLRIQVSGRGTLDNVNLALPSGWDKFKLYPPSSKVETTDALGLEGIKTFEQVVTPQQLEVREVPVVSFAFFDPEERQYKILKQGPTPVLVSPASQVNLAGPSPSTGASSTARGTELANNKSRLGMLSPIAAPWLQQPRFVGLQLIPVLIWITSVVYRRRLDRLMADPRLRRRRQADRTVREGMKKLRRLAEAGQGEDFFVLMFRLMQEQIGASLNLPASAITEADVEDRLRQAGLPETALGNLLSLFQVCDRVRYSRQHSVTDLVGLCQQLETCLAELRSFHLAKESSPGT
jgi:hypothetical protein